RHTNPLPGVNPKPGPQGQDIYSKIFVEYNSVSAELEENKGVFPILMGECFFFILILGRKNKN
ncbi:hypothetical protein, partial [Desulfobacula sp.]|uniref:hypothetical protein n=1 Tax=Desulfobacula sp. TaxID=2593537 RepID=UPI0027146E70